MPSPLLVRYWQSLPKIKYSDVKFAKYVDFTKYLFFISCLKNINKQYYSNRIIQAYKSLVMSLGLVVINLNSLVC